MFSRMFRSVSCGAMLMATALMAAEGAAATQGPLTIAYMGSHGNTGYVGFSAQLTEGCNWGNVYYNISTDEGKAYHSALLTAHASGRPVTRIDYAKDAQGMCWLNLVMI